MTNLLYYNSAYLAEWQTVIHTVLEKEDGIYLTLEETAFYPHGGGQPCDEGTIGGIPVLDVSKEGETIWHKVESMPEETSVVCRLNWDRRFDHMQQHSGQHLLSATCLETLGAQTLSFHLGVDYATIDVELPELSSERLVLLEKEVNRHIYLNHEITSYFVTDEVAARLPLVKQPKVTGDIRIVEIKGVEYNACGGTHVSSTGEIGMIKLLKAERQKGNTRIYFLCGYRALQEFNESQRILTALAQKFNIGKDGILDRLDKWEQEHKQLQWELNAQREKNDEFVVKELLSQSKVGLIAQVFEDRSLKDLQNLATRLAAESKVPVLFVAGGDNKVLMAYGGDGGFSCGAFFKEHLGGYNGKGGGSDKLAQAGFGSWAEALAFYEFAKTGCSD
ncbi:alanyl-tRNA editing protein [Paenibacillus sp. Marseille-P2973]|uniref:alanyl-tRNA editing protein n=1 Tax=Paenibacillus sp. Marseille-P2973 TaxID=1871032 RepID=UPI001B365B81|nr:DHHA1 domain-containing protein [Paenibacillus sp. Marseille-P2973]MBQ4898307.1 alanyl-tRNA editing protein [Paenibacillus sp. Marseille-P2973]